MIKTYAQNLEDIFLYRCFKNQDKGFYIDVGAWEPTYHNVTKLFYDMGWHGINIEPNQACFSKLVKSRTRDINLNSIISDNSSDLEYFNIQNSGLSSTLPELRDKYQKMGFKVEAKIHHPITLKEVCEKYVGSKEIDFLKIDVEGMEEKVLLGMDFKKFRPKVILIEAILPGSTQISSQSWEKILFSNDYSEVYFDGVNKFYLAKERSDLSIFFNTPINIFDGVINYRFYYLAVFYSHYDFLSSRNFIMRFISSCVRSLFSIMKNVLK